MAHRNRAEISDTGKGRAVSRRDPKRAEQLAADAAQIVARAEAGDSSAQRHVDVIAAQLDRYWRRTDRAAASHA